MTDKECIKRGINDLLIFYSVYNDQLHLVRQAWIFWFNVIHIVYLIKDYCYYYKQEMINNNNEILRWIEAIKSNGRNVNPFGILIFSFYKNLEWSSYINLN